MKKTVKVLLALVVLFVGFSFVNAKDNTVLAAETDNEYKTVLMDVKKDETPVCTDDGKEWLFAGWFEDAKCEVAYHSFPTGVTQAYAKFVPEKVLSVKLQLTEGTNEDSDKTNMRLVSSVDSLDYRKVGFEVYFNGAEEPVNISTSKVYERIVASAESGVDYNYSPKVVNTESEYFVTATLINISNTETTKNFDKSFYIRPYWVTLDGTTVYGENRFVTVEDGYSTSIINMPVKMDEVSSQNLTVSGVEGATVELANYDGTYAHVRINLGTTGKADLKSVTTFTVGDTKAQYRNLVTTHVVVGDTSAINADTSWYDSEENMHILATSADLYGFATSMKNGNNFANHTVYVVCDIEANTSDSKYEWPIGGSTNYAFAGTFDGQMHTISGLYQTGKSYQGLFSLVTNSANIRNFSLTDSLFENSGVNSGSIAGRVQGGTYESIYSDAEVKGSSTSIGGLIGQHQRSTSALTMTDCWFAGSVTNSNQYTGGLIGNALSASTITNCLNTGTIHGTQTRVGGFVGNVDDQKVTLSYCLNDGTVTSDATSGIGAIAGTLVEDTSPGSVVCNNVYMVEEKCSVMVNDADVEGVTAVTTTSVAGVKALTATTKTLFSYINEETQETASYWAIVPNGAPVLVSFAEFANAMAVDTSWYNTVDTEFILTDAADLYGLALLSKTNNFENQTVKLSADITINEGTPDDWKTETPLHNWLAIGTSDVKFAGTFDGQMHSINGMYLSATESYVGMFAYTNTYATVRNLKLMNSYFETTKGAVGSIAGYGYGTFDTIYSDAYVEGGTFWIGGLIGQTHSASTMKMNNCWFDGEIIQSGTGNVGQRACVGGLLGLANNTVTIANCLNTGSVNVAYTASEDPCVGGLVGRVSADKTLTIQNCFDAGSVSVAEGATSAYGPIIGKVETSDKTTITDTFTYTENYVENVSASYTGVTNVSKDEILGTDALKKMTKFFTNKISATEYESCWAVVLNDAPVLESFTDVTDKEFLVIDTSWYNGNGSYTLKDASDLYGFTMLSARIDFAGETISLSKDIDSIIINEGKPYGEDGKAGGGDDWEPKYEWISVGSTSKPFAGIFNGNMKSIEGAYWNTESFSGLFSAVKAGSVIQNLSLKNSYMETSGVNNGSIVGRALGGTIDTVYSDAIVIGNNTNIGGLVGQVSSSATETITLNNCWFAGSVTNNASATQNTGGLIGTVLYDSNITNCLNTGAISMPNYTKNEGTEETPIVKPCIGGFAGNMADKAILFSYCFNAGVITYNSATTTGFGTFTGYTPSTSVCFEHSYSTIENNLTAYARGSSATILSDYGRFYKSEAYGTKALEKAKALFDAKEDENYRYYWAIVPNNIPVLASFAEYAGEEFITIDTSWYDANKESYTLNDEGDLYGFALLSYEEAIAGYAGKTITLGKDITINEGTPYGADGVVGGGDDWTDVVPQYEWVSICGDTNYRFGGTFEGNGKTISGIYLDADEAYRGLFGLVGVGATVRNFSLTNSYFSNSAQAVGSIAGHARGTFDTIYSNAIVVGNNSNVGGIIGQISGDGMESLSNCWFDGTVTNNATDKQSTGGLIGAGNGDVTIVNCLNTSAVSAPNYVREEINGETVSIKPLVGGLIGYAAPAANITVQHCLNTGKVSFNSVATAGFGSVIGRIGSRAEGVTEDGNIIVENTYATSQSSWETVSTSNTWSQVSVTVVDDNVIGGENAREIMPGLFNEELTSSWVTGVQCPILKDFATYAATEKSIGALHQWLTSGESLSATLQNPVTLPNPDNVALADIRRQGGFTDGQYFYQAYITYTDPGTDEVAEETGNIVKVLKYDLASGDYVWSDELALNHANDITYNSKLGCLVVCHASPNAKQVSYINVTETGLEFKETVTIDYSISYIDYNEERDVYIAGTSAKFFVLNSEFKKISKDFIPDRVSGEHTGQGVSCDDDYIYFVLSAGTVETEIIEVYDWSGKLVQTVTLNIETDSETIESENISVVGDKIYIMVAELSSIAGVQYDKPANVYTIDLSVPK